MKRYITLNITFFIVLMFIVLAPSCKKKKVEKFDFQTEYFGLDKGRFIEYDITYIFHDSLLKKHDTVYYQIKTWIGDTIIDNSGRVGREFHRFKRADSNKFWKPTDIWMAIIDGNRAELVEENQRKIKMVFAPTEDKTWDINSFNNTGKMMAKYSDIAAAKEINNFTFDSTVTVEKLDYKTLIDEHRQYEVYAKGIGMVYSYYKNLTFKFGSSTPIKGEEYYYSIVNYGVE